MLLDALAGQCTRRMAQNRIGKDQLGIPIVLIPPFAEADSGLIVNTCGWIDGVGFEVLMHAITAFQAGNLHLFDFLLNAYRFDPMHG